MFDEVDSNNYCPDNDIILPSHLSAFVSGVKYRKSLESLTLQPSIMTEKHHAELIQCTEI